MEKLEKKVRTYNFLKKISPIPFVASVILALGSVFYNPSLPEPQIFKDYQNAQKIKNILEKERQELSQKINLPYKTKETESAFKILYNGWAGQTNTLNEAIMGIENSISEIEENSELKQFFEQQEIAGESHTKRNIGTFLLALLLGTGMNYSFDKSRKYRKELENLAEAQANVSA